ncbi:dienelactone hydrolase family protein [Bacillus carboniphilus]|uniref:Dienelactone hydrolase family protein n=1 Tax=Bacillus carboniphilus TaxID=86663 RepID=A0ABY9JQH1_9BACI|nr:dienelactone hydrolase family protein [Bacillus carboniphilus]WLR41649.1 dienelactone hydrolase family protein [Bacillus carboniphilus]
MGSFNDIRADAQLVSEFTPHQVRAAVDYYEEMDEKYKKVGGVSYVTGNSLGGGLTNAVAVQNPGVTAVTLNPSPLPEHMIEPGQPYDNITNYCSDFDVLTKSLDAGGYGHQIPGKRYNINNGIPGIDQAITNHTGYRNTKDGIQYYTIGEKGKPGYGRIYIDADSHIVTSIWTGIPLYGGYSERIDIDKEKHDPFSVIS